MMLCASLLAELDKRGHDHYGPVAQRAAFLMEPGNNFAPDDAVERAVAYCSRQR